MAARARHCAVRAALQQDVRFANSLCGVNVYVEKGVNSTALLLYMLSPVLWARLILHKERSGRTHYADMNF